MSDTCIVCLGDLNLSESRVAAQSVTDAKSQPFLEFTAASEPLDTTDDAPELVAHLQPCGHDLHNACLKPWVERANSCPICRATFNLVELQHHVGGNVISSYQVQDRTQVADLDPAMFLELPEEDEEDEPCQACGECDNDDVLMYCDGCNKLWHTYCVDLQEVPRSAWYCSNCRALRGTRPQGRPGGSSRRRTRGQQRRQRTQHVSHDSEWNDVWQSVFSRLGMDLDFPHDDDAASANAMRRHRQRVQASRQAHHAWQSRLRVAELAGAGPSFREHEAAILTVNLRRLRPSPQPYVETPEEADAWNAFDEARAPASEASASTKRKRQSTSRTSSPAEPSGTAPAQVKRRRISPPRASPSTREVQEPDTTHVSPQPRRPQPVDGPGPSFLQSLLQEVEDSSSTGSHFQIHRTIQRGAGSPPADHNSPHPSSPAISPSPSNHSSPRAMSATPPPPSNIRPNSPVGLSSSIRPIYPSTEYSPQRITPEPHDTGPESPTRVKSSPVALPRPKLPKRARIPRQTVIASRPRSTGSSPTRHPLSLMAKSDVQKMVSAALKPHYHDQKITKDEYTTINRNVSRMLYEKIGNFESLDLIGKTKWEKVAGEEVNKAVVALRPQT